MLAGAHAVGWPIAAGGARTLSAALAGHLVELGGKIVTDCPIASLDALPSHRAALLDLTPRQILDVAGHRLERQRWGQAYVRQLRRFRYGPGVFKLDLALDGPIPWRDPEVLRAATVHVGGPFEEIAAAEAAVAEGRIPERPFVLLGQPSLVEASRAPPGKHTVWAYCHVPNGSTVDMADRMFAQIERFAPGFRDRILAFSQFTPADLQRYDANYIGGDIGGGRSDIRRSRGRPGASTPTARPTRRSSCAPRRRRLAGASTGSAGGMRRDQRCGARCERSWNGPT
jgi:phytoene dehydrogenase-like protein